MVLQLGQWKQILAITALKLIKNITQQRFQEMARYGIYQKWKRYLIKSFSYICKGLVLVHRHFLKPRHVVKQFSWNRKNHIMNDSLIKDYLTFFKNEKVDLRNEGINEKIDFYFERTSFLNNIEILENNSLIIETEHGNCTYLITEKGEKYLKQITEKLDYEAEKERIEFEKSKTDLVLAQKMLKEFPKTKMFSRISLFIAIVLALKELYILIKPIL